MIFKVHGSNCFINVAGGKERQPMSVAHEKWKYQTAPLHPPLQSPLAMYIVTVLGMRAGYTVGLKGQEDPGCVPLPSNQCSSPQRCKCLLFILQVLPQQRQTLQLKSASLAHWTEEKNVAWVLVFHSQMVLLQMWGDPGCSHGTGMLAVRSNSVPPACVVALGSQLSSRRPQRLQLSFPDKKRSVPKALALGRTP